MSRFPLTIFVSAFLLFQVQPMIGRYILPWFGGGPGVWTVCLLFFQGMLLLGYGYAHLLASRVPGRAQSIVHALLLAVSLVFLPIVPQKPVIEDAPTRQILFLLLRTVGMPYLLLASTAPLIQRWFHAREGNSPYRLYALSNIGSLLALLSYPFVIEPLLPLRQQANIWSGLYLLFAAGSAASAFLAQRSPRAPAASRTSVGTLLYWLALSACGSALLLATTSQMCQEVASVPFLWILPLTIYLLTFILAFDADRWYGRRWTALLAGVAVPAACGVVAAGLNVTVSIHIAALSLVLFVCALICHGELAQSRPEPERLTTFYLVISAGGATGGLFVAIVAPRIFTVFTELYIALQFACVLALLSWYRSREWTLYPGRPYWVVAPLSGLGLALVVAVIAMPNAPGPQTLARYRNFYGILRVTDDEDNLGPKRSLTHGRITHGFQYTDAFKRSWPTSYFGRDSAIGLALANHPRRPGPLRIGVIGLGAGTIAAYGRPGDVLRFYEINPDVVRVANDFFSYVKDSGAATDVVLGDARIRLEQQASRGELQNFDVLAVDAFSSDAIPLHLLTRECTDLYRRHLAPGGLLLLHISNRSLDLVPIARAIAIYLRWRLVEIQSPGDETKGTYRATWAILTENSAFVESPKIQAAAREPGTLPPILWTDDFASLRRVLK